MDIWEIWDNEDGPDVTGPSVETDPWDEDDDSDSEDYWDEECEGHESLRADSMGITVFCDGECLTR